MDPLKKPERDRFLQEIEILHQSDPTYQFLNECVVGLRDEYIQQMKVKNKDSFYSYVDAERILRRHAEYLAYRLGLQHGKDSDN